MSPQKISIKLKKTSETDKAYCGKADLGDYYFAIRPAPYSQTWPTFTSPLHSNACYQTMDYYGPIDKMDEVTVQIVGDASNLTLILSRDDADWRFIISKTDLETVKSARHLNVAVPMPHQIDAEAGISFETGVCIEDKNPDNEVR